MDTTEDANVSMPKVCAERWNLSWARSGHRTVRVVVDMDWRRRAMVSVRVVISCRLC